MPFLPLSSSLLTDIFAAGTCLAAGLMIIDHLRQAWTMLVPMLREEVTPRNIDPKHPRGISRGHLR